MSVNGIPLSRVKDKMDCEEKDFNEVGQILDRYVTFSKMKTLGISISMNDVSYDDLNNFSIIHEVIEEHKARKQNGN